VPKYHAMKEYEGHGNKRSRILDLCIRWSWAVASSSGLLTPWKKELSVQESGWLQRWSGSADEEKKSLLFSGVEFCHSATLLTGVRVHTLPFTPPYTSIINDLCSWCNFGFRKSIELLDRPNSYQLLEVYLIDVTVPLRRKVQKVVR